MHRLGEAFDKLKTYPAGKPPANPLSLLNYIYLDDKRNLSNFSALTAPSFEL